MNPKGRCRRDIESNLGKRIECLDIIPWTLEKRKNTKASIHKRVHTRSQIWWYSGKRVTYQDGNLVAEMAIGYQIRREKEKRRNQCGNKELFLFFLETNIKREQRSFLFHIACFDEALPTKPGVMARTIGATTVTLSRNKTGFLLAMSPPLSAQMVHSSSTSGWREPLPRSNKCPKNLIFG